MLLSVSFGTYKRRRRDVLIGRQRYVPLRRLGDVPRRRRWVFLLRCNCDVSEKNRETQHVINIGISFLKFLLLLLQIHFYCQLMHASVRNYSSLGRMLSQSRVHISDDQLVYLKVCYFPTTKALENLDVLQERIPERTIDSIFGIVAISSCRNIISTPTIQFVRSCPDIISLLRDTTLYSALQSNASLILLGLLLLQTTWYETYQHQLPAEGLLEFCTTPFKQSIHEFYDPKSLHFFLACWSV